MSDQHQDKNDTYALHNFAQVIAALEDGDLNSNLTDKMRDLIAEINDVAKEKGGKAGGTISLTIAFKYDSGVIEVCAADPVLKKPKETRRKTLMWATPGNLLTQKNPKQQELPFRDVSRQQTYAG